MKIGIMQPYFIPYLGYFQLMNAVDQFVIYDNIQYTKKGWINRNRLLINGKDEYITLQIKKDSDYLNVDQRSLADAFETDKNKLLRKIDQAYKKAPMYPEVMPILHEIMNFNEKNLFQFILNTIKVINRYLNIQTPIVISSQVDIDHQNLKAQDKVLAICKALSGTEYINPIGGVELYQRKDFLKEGLQLHFIKTRVVPYPQFNNDFIPFLSIIDVMFFNDKTMMSRLLLEYDME